MTGSASDEEDELWRALGPKEVSAAEVRRELEALKAGRFGFGALEIPRPSALDPLCESLVALATKALADGHADAAAEALEGLLDVIPAGHARRGEVESLAVEVRAMAKGRSPADERAPRPAEVVDPALSAGYLLMAAQDGELTPEEAAALEERLGPADAALRVEWGWLEKARGALGRVATFEPAADDPLWERLRAGVRDGLDRPAPSSGDPDVAKQLRAMQSSLADQLRRSLGTLGRSSKDFDLSPEAAAALFASGPPTPPAVRSPSGSDEPPGWPRRAVRTSRVVGSLEVATLHLPAAEPFGDVVDVSAHPGGVDVVLLDPSGRGPDAHAIGLAAQVGLQAALAAGAAPSAAVAATNRALHGATARHMFVAGTLVRWEEARGVAVVAGAGGEELVVRRARGGGVERVKVPGVVLGAVSELPPLQAREVPLAPGDLLLLVSDGVTEQPGADDAPFCEPSWARLLELVTRLGHLEAAAFVATLEAVLRAWGGLGQGAPRDDVVVVALRRRRDLVTSV